MSDEKKSSSLKKPLIGLVLLGGLVLGAFTLPFLPCPPKVHAWIICPYCGGSDKVTVANWVRGNVTWLMKAAK